MEKVIDCRKCGNCDMVNECCKIYGSDPAKAVAECASKNFGAYRPGKRKMDAEVQHEKMQSVR